MKTITAEVYYGYYLGDAQMWSTDYVEIPEDTPEDRYEEIAKGVFMEALNANKSDIHLAFCGLYCIDEDSMEDD